MRLSVFNLLCAWLMIWPAGAWASQRLAYYSDYFSFFGRDDGGYVAFALDNNRGIDGDDYQAEHFGVLYDQHAGWITLHGTGDYANPQGELASIPDSPAIAFDGSPVDGLVISSEKNILSLRIQPIAIHLEEKEPQRTQKWGTAAATLSWRGRKIRGRIIYEQLVYLNWNRLTRTYSGTWDNFQGFYLTLQSGDTENWQDFYLRSQGHGSSLRTKGFVSSDNGFQAIQASRLKASDYALNWGFYRWPQAWEIDLAGNSKPPASPGRLTLRQISRSNQGNWVIGGFAMTVVAGELRLNGQVIPVLGFVELIK